jgi:hypothetical protein
VADWVTISALATAGGTLVLAGATFASVRSANRAARVAERSLLANQRPLLMQSRLQDESQKVGFADGRWLTVAAGQGAADVSDDAIYLTISLRNVGAGMAVLHGWWFYPERVLSAGPEPRAPERFHRLTRDLYIPPSDVGFWQGVFRDPGEEQFKRASEVIRARDPFTVDLLYGDHEGGQRVVSRFVLSPREDGGWIASVGRHWNIDRPDPR